MSWILKIGRLGYILLPVLVLLFILLNWLENLFLKPYQSLADKKVPFVVEKDSNLKIISQDLVREGLIKKWYSVYYLKFLKKGANSIVSGEYSLSPGMSPIEIYQNLVNKKIITHPVTIPEGTKLSEIPQILAKSGLVTEREVKAALYNRSLMQKLDIHGGTLEGWLAPETYNLSRPATAESIIARIVMEGRSRLDTMLKGWRERAAYLKMTPQQIMTIASIIEAEAQKPEERSVISSVYHNRLRIEMPLQSDPTVIYGIPNFNGNLTKDNLKTPGPYNTYLNTGLPPSPICNPGIESIKAALYPDDTDYIYFVAKGDGSHKFSSNYKDHQQAVSFFQKLKE